MGKNLFVNRPGGFRQYSTEHWDVIDDMDQIIPSCLEELLRERKSKKKKYDEQHYNVHVYKVLPYPPGSKERLNLSPARSPSVFGCVLSF